MKRENQKVKNKLGCICFRFLLACVFALFLHLPVNAQTLAFLTPDKADTSKRFAETLKKTAETRLKVLDDSLAEAAYLSVSPATPFNLTTQEAKRIGTAIGCDVFVLIRSATQRRSAFQRAEYYESYAAVYAVSSRTGRLVFWKLQQSEAESGDRSARLLRDSAAGLASELETGVRSAVRNEIAADDPPVMEEFSEDVSRVATTARAPVPYQRIRPEYTAQASLYDVAATIDLEVFLDEKGIILRTEVIRWAGFGLDESVDKNVRSMNWRPAERGGKPIAMKFLVRYNFKKFE